MTNFKRVIPSFYLLFHVPFNFIVFLLLFFFVCVCNQMDCFSNKQSGFGLDFFFLGQLRHNYHMIPSLYPWCVCVCALMCMCACAYVFDMVLFFNLENVFYMDMIINMTL